MDNGFAVTPVTALGFCAIVAMIGELSYTVVLGKIERLHIE
jgi:MFS transporter, ACS family, D-galactonate transporter